MEWACAVVTVLTNELMTRKLWYGWAVAMFNNGLWFHYSYSTSQWGMFSLTAVCTVQSVRGLIYWLSERHGESLS